MGEVEEVSVTPVSSVSVSARPVWTSSPHPGSTDREKLVWNKLVVSITEEEKKTFLKKTYFISSETHEKKDGYLLRWSS